MTCVKWGGEIGSVIVSVSFFLLEKFSEIITWNIEDKIGLAFPKNIFIFWQKNPLYP